VSSWLAPGPVAGDRGFVATLLSDSPLQTPSAWSVHHVPAEIVTESHSEEESSSCVPATPPEAITAAAVSRTSAPASQEAAQLIPRAAAAADSPACTPLSVPDGTDTAVAATPETGATQASSGAWFHAATRWRCLSC